MLALVASARPTQSLDGAGALAFSRPTAAIKGDVLVMLAIRDPGVAQGVPPAGWTLSQNGVGAGTAKLDAWTKLVDDEEPVDVTLGGCSPSAEWQGQMLVLRGGNANTLHEAIASAAYTADATPDTPPALCQQAISLLLCAWQSTSAITLTAPVGFSQIDAYSSSLVAARTLLLAHRRANDSGTVSPDPATGSGASSGRAFTWVVRDGIPITPVEISDVVPGHIGLVGTDNRRGR